MLAVTRGVRLLFILVLSACGARSSLLDDGDGAGGETSSLVAPVGATASAVTAGGEGGSYVPCTQPTVRPPAVIFEPLGDMPVHDLSFVDAGSGVVVTARFASESKTASDHIGHAAWDAWGVWPPAPFDPLSTAAASGATAPVFATPSEELALSYIDFPGCLQRVGSGLDPSASYGSPESHPISNVVGQGCERVPQGVAGRSGGPHASATRTPFPGGPEGSYFMETALVSAGGGLITYGLEACGGMPLYGDMGLLNDEFVIATSNASPDYGCVSPQGSPNWVGIGWLGSLEFHLVVASDADEIAGVQLVPRPGGLWLLWRESGASAFTTPPVWASRLDETLYPESFYALTSEGLSRFSAAAHDLGGIVIVSDESLGAGGIDLRVWDAEGTLLTQHTIPVGSAAPSSERLSVVASPDGGSALVGWTGLDGRGYAARVDCMLGVAVP